VKVTFFTAIINVQVASISGRGDEISDGFYIMTDQDVVSELLIPDVRRAIGELECDFLRAAPAIMVPVSRSLPRECQNVFECYVVGQRQCGGQRTWVPNLWSRT
jgi:hypothetical protein